MSESSSSSSSNSYKPCRSPTSNRRFRVPSNPWLPYIGDCRALEKYLKSKKGVGWLIPKYLNALLRGVSQVPEVFVMSSIVAFTMCHVVFANNPLAGIIILIALLWSNVVVGLAAIVAATTAILTAALMRQDPASISAGLTTFNSVLIGTVTSSLWTPRYGEELGYKLWGFIILGAALSVFVTSAISNLLSSYKVSLPVLTLPFNIVTLLIFICLMPMPHRVHDHDSNKGPVPLRLVQQHPNNLISSNSILNDFANKGNNGMNPMNVTSRKVRQTGAKPSSNAGSGATSEKVLNWGEILQGIVLSAGQIYGVNDIIGSVLIYIAILVYSPILFMMSVFGAILGTICGTFFTPSPYVAIYTGIWGYNSILSAACVGGFFIVLTCHSFWTAMVNVVFTVLVQQALTIVFIHFNLPIFSIPFALSSILFLSVTTVGNHMPRVKKITFPEIHRYNYREGNRVKMGDKMQNQASEVPEEKELVLTDVKVIGDEEVVVAAQVETVEDTEKDGDEDNEETKLQS